MGSLTSCIKKAGKAISSEDKTAIVKAAAKLREGGMSNADASMRAVEEQIEAIKALIVAAGGDPAESANVPKAKDKIQDFGEKLEGARKDFAARMKEAMEADIKAEPLSKSWPEPDYQKLLDGGADPFTVAWVRASRDEIPVKPKVGWKLDGWVKRVELLRGFSAQLLDGSIAKEKLQEKLGLPEFDRLRSVIGGRADLYQEFGHGKSLKGVRIEEHYFSFYKGAKNVTKWVVEQDSTASAFSNWPRELASGDTKEEALAAFREKYESVGAKTESKTSFDIYRKRGLPGVFVGKKIGREYIDLKKVDDVAEARRVVKDEAQELERLLDAYKSTPFERKEENAPRVGADHRNGAPVTPEIFAETFGFRGVQFGNYVEQDRRQSDLNQAFDGLMDLASVLGLPPKALSLNGRLGLAFGARGKGGKNAPAAHYEGDTVVINLTKNSGPGSLAHEWWHALDNYFGRMGGVGYGTDQAMRQGVRDVMESAFRSVRAATQAKGLRARSAELDKRRTKEYWNTAVELSARSFESYVIAKLQDHGTSNDYLANVVSKEYWDASEALRQGMLEEGDKAETYPYPTADELPAVRAAFDDFFKTIEVKPDEGGKLALLSQAESENSPVARIAEHIKANADAGPKAVKERMKLAEELAPVADGLIVPAKSGGYLAATKSGNAWRVLSLDDSMQESGSTSFDTPKAALAHMIARADAGRMADTKAAPILSQSSQTDTIEAVRTSWDSRGIQSAIFERGGIITLSKIIVPSERRGAGVATEAMNELTAYADRTGQRIALSPSGDFGGSKVRLVPFYKRFGFVENKGRNKDFTISESMVREPLNRGTFDPQNPSILLSQAAKFKPGTAKASIQAMVDASRASWSDAPPVTVVDSVDGLPTHIQDAIASQGATGTVRALVMPDTGLVYLIADRLNSVDEAQFVLFHEVLGHYGMRKFLGDKYAPELDKLRKANPALAREAMRWFQAYGQGHINARTAQGMDFTQAVREVSLLSVEEALADRAGDAKPLSGFKSFMAKVQAALRNIGLGKVADMLEGMTEAETFALLAHARRSVESGPARESFAIGLKGPMFSRGTQEDMPDKKSLDQQRSALDSKIAEARLAVSNAEQAIESIKRSRDKDTAKADYVARMIREDAELKAKADARRNPEDQTRLEDRVSALMESFRGDKARLLRYSSQFDQQPRVKPERSDDIKRAEDALSDEQQSLYALIRQREVMAEVSQSNAQPSQRLTLYHGGNAGLTAIEGESGAGDVFGGIFASTSERAARSHGDGSLYSVEIDRDKVLYQSLLNSLPYRDVADALRTAMPNLSKGDFELAYQAVVDDDANNIGGNELMRVFGGDSAGVASWEAQRIRGKLAALLGYQAVEMLDEHGVTYLVLPGVKVTPEQRAPILSQSDPIAESEWSIGDPSKLDDLIFNYQDKQVDLRRSIQAIRAAGREIEDRFDAYLQEELYHGRSAKRVEDFANLELAPLLKDMAARGITQERLDHYLHARHAKEANEHVAKINRKPDHGQIGIDGKPVESPLQDGGSGMKTADAQAFLDGLDPAEKKRLEAVAAKVDAIIAKNRALVVSYGLESADTVDGWSQMFEHYVPLMREDEGGGMGTGQGFSIKGKEAKHRTGSTAKVVDILANIAMQRERTIVRGEKNRVAVALAGLVHTNPNPDLWSLVPTKERFLNERTGLVENRDVPNLKSLNNVVVAKIRAADGSVQERAIIFNEKSERAQRMAAALKNLDAAQVEGVLTLIQPVTRYLASINTQYNPIFGIVNFTRDVQGALLNLGSTDIAGEQAKVAAESAKLFGQVLKSGFRLDKSDAAALWKEYQDEGGQTGFKDLFATSADRAREIDKQLDPDWWTKTLLGKVATAGGLAAKPMSAAHQKVTAPLFDWLSDYNTALENVVRMAAYKVAREKGISKQRSASLAKNLTVNFNRKGSKSPGVAALYAFFNASVQGTARLGQTLFTMEGGEIKTLRLSKAGKQIVAGGVLLGVLQAIALHLAGYDDENPPEYVRERNFIIPLGERGKYITIPMPLGFHVLPGIGRIATEFFLSGGKDPGKKVGSIASMLMGTFNPIGGGATFAQTVMPTVGDPIVALSENKDFTGSPISRTTYSKNEPGFRNAKDTATPWGKFIAEAVNTLSGGSSAKQGALSPTPDDIDYLIGQVTGGVGREVGKLAEVVSAAKSGEVPATNKIPLLGRFFGDAASSSGQARQFYAHLEKIREAADVVKTMRKDIRDGTNGTTPEDLKAHIAENKLLPLAMQADSLAKRLKAMRQERRKHLEAGNRARVTEIEENMKKIMSDFNDRVRAMEEKSTGVAKPKELEYQ